MPMRCLWLAIALAAGAAHAERPVYRSVDAQGRVVYSDRASANSETVKQWMPVSQDAHEYDGGRVRAARDELYYWQLQNEPHQPRVYLYDPRGWASRRPNPLPSTRWYDPNLPPSQPPSLERRYYYDGR